MSYPHTVVNTKAPIPWVQGGCSQGDKTIDIADAIQVQVECPLAV